MTPDEFDALNRDDRVAMLLAMYVRNAMEDFHSEHLSDAQMAELNPIIRRALYEGFRDIVAPESDERAARRMWFEAMLIPSYWEPPSALPPTLEL